MAQVAEPFWETVVLKPLVKVRVYFLFVFAATALDVVYSKKLKGSLPAALAHRNSICSVVR